MIALESRPLNGQSGHEAGRRLLRELVEGYTGEPMPEIQLEKLGKPFFPGNPVHFSISHTRNRVFCVLADRPVGLDAEELTREVNPKLAQKILSAPEYAQYAQSADKNRALLTFWVLKEARAKFTGEGIRGYPNKITVSLEDHRVKIMDGCLVAVIEEGERPCFLIPMPIWMTGHFAKTEPSFWHR